MLDIKFIRENPEIVKKAAQNKGIDIDIEHILEIDNKLRGLDLMVQKLREDRNKFAKAASNAVGKEEAINKGKEIKVRLEKQENALKAVSEELREWLLKIPNPAKKDVKIGKDDSDNEVIRKWGEIRKFDFKLLDHLDLGEKLDIIDVKRASKVSGARFGYLKGDAVLLEFALIQLGLEMLIKEGFIPVVPPVLVTKEVMKGLGYMENGGEEDMYHLEKDDMYLVGTAEHALVPMHKDEVLSAKDLPIRYVGFSSAFRREAGSYGKDTKGILRVHQFDKLEMVSFVKDGEDDKEHEYLLSLEEKLFKALEIPYQVVKMCSGDLGFPAARKYDLEAWMPGQGKYREVTSVSTVTDFQSRRLNIKYQDGNDKKYVNILNGTGFAFGRTIIAILENYQKEDGSIEIPKVLQKYIGKSTIKE
ncbi:MAG: serine--tRNA ligase [Patescibacteria group bacterium]